MDTVADDMLKRRNEVWDTFEKLSDKKKVEWLLEFDIIFKQVMDWDASVQRKEIERMNAWIQEE